MKIKKRSSDLSVEKISNGYVLTLTGRDVNNNYCTDKLFVTGNETLNDVISEYFDLPEDD